MQQPHVSVVTPVHNGATHLAECLESVRAQTYASWEHVVVDNCSSDATSEIARAFAASDTRIRHVRYDELVDVIASYNRAVGHVAPRSAYCKVLGADDLLYPACLERMVDVAERHPAVGVVSSYRQNGDAIDLRVLPPGQETLAGRDLIARGLCSDRALTGSPTALLLRADLVRERRPFYDSTFRHADSEAAYWTLTRSDYGFVHEVLTFNRPASRETVSSDVLGSYLPERLRLLVRYGPESMTHDAYRVELRRQLRRYVRSQLRLFAWWHTKGHFASHRAAVGDGRAFNRRSIELLAVEAGSDPEVQRSLRFVRALLR